MQVRPEGIEQSTWDALPLEIQKELRLSAMNLHHKEFESKSIGQRQASISSSIIDLTDGSASENNKRVGTDLDCRNVMDGNNDDDNDGIEVLVAVAKKTRNEYTTSSRTVAIESGDAPEEVVERKTKGFLVGDTSQNKNIDARAWLLSDLAENEMKEAFSRCSDFQQSDFDVNGLFYDEVFPPDIHSIDGRQVHLRNESNYSMNNESPTSNSQTAGSNKKSGNNPIEGEKERMFQGKKQPCCCKCNVKAKLCTVMKDGVNQGRHFWGCSRKAPQRCDYFKWAEKDAPHTKKDLDLIWKRLGLAEGYRVVNEKRDPLFSPDDIKQGGVGDCWFLSALAVLAERQDLVRQVMIPQDVTDLSKGIYKVCLFIDGSWRIFTVDNYFPVRQPLPQAAAAASAASNNAKIKRLPITKGGGTDQLAYSKPVDRQLWVAIIEKAYAKAHNCYHSISGGWIAEALFDLTACPTETIVFDRQDFCSETFWARLMSFHQEGFLMGASCHRSGDGLVGSHAYSILEVRDLKDVVLGKQLQISDFFGNKSSSISSCEGNRSSIESNNTRSDANNFRIPDPSPGVTKEGTLRLVKLRNPWGKKEWKGSFGSGSEVWTKHLKQVLGAASVDTDDGVFYMSYHDFISRFYSVDVCKAHKNWYSRTFQNSFPGDSWTSLLCFEFRIFEPTWLYITAAQPSKRGKAGKRYWYTDISIMVLNITTNGKRAEILGFEKVDFSGESKVFHTEFILSDANTTYLCIPFSVGRAHRYSASLSATKRPHTLSSNFAVRFFSSKIISIRPRDHVPADIVVKALHESVKSLENFSCHQETYRSNMEKVAIRVKHLVVNKLRLIVNESRAGVCIVIAENLDETLPVKIRLLVHGAAIGPSATSFQPFGNKLPWRFVPPRSRCIIETCASSGYQDYEFDGPGGFAVDNIEYEFFAPLNVDYVRTINNMQGLLKPQKV